MVRVAKSPRDSRTTMPSMRSMAGMTSMALEPHEPVEEGEPHLLALLRVELHREEVLPGEGRAVGAPVIREQLRSLRVGRGRVGVGEVDVLPVERGEERVARPDRPDG